MSCALCRVVTQYGERRLLHDKEHIMFARLSHFLGKMVPGHDVSSHSDYLASSSDLADLERRMRQVDEEEHAYRMPFCGAVSRDQNSFGSKH
jgi:hypothetical protein